MKSCFPFSAENEANIKHPENEVKKMIEAKIISSLENIFPDSAYLTFPEKKSISVLRNERFTFQLLYTLTPNDNLPNEWCVRFSVTAEGGLAKYATLRTVDYLPVLLPAYPNVPDDGNYLRRTPGLYPDVLTPLHYGNCAHAVKGQTHAIWIDVNADGETLPAGVHALALHIVGEDGTDITREISVDVIDALLPEQTTKFTQWFHSDCLSEYYRVPVWSDEHFRIIENFVKCATRNGINMLLIPVFTPPLDTKIGGERPTVQLVDVRKDGGKYSFGFEKLDRFLDLAKRCGIKYYEICHFFTQWGAQHAPKIMATVDGEYKKIFGWESDAVGEYSDFLRIFIPELLSHMKSRGEDKKCFFHISDEPLSEEAIACYTKAKNSIADLLCGYTIMDAVSHYEIYERGVLETPIPCNDHIQPFIDHGVKNLWTYYCCAQCNGVSNRLISMPSWRNRSIGMQMYRYNIVGFLQWGYNFYYNRTSVDNVNPYYDLSGDYWVPAGDTCSVYPGRDGDALESLRIIVFYEALEDQRAMQLCESLIGRERTVSELEAAFGAPIVFSDCARSAAQLERTRERINALIKEAVSK